MKLWPTKPERGDWRTLFCRSSWYPSSDRTFFDDQMDVQTAEQCSRSASEEPYCTANDRLSHMHDKEDENRITKSSFTNANNESANNEWCKAVKRDKVCFTMQPYIRALVSITLLYFHQYLLYMHTVHVVRLYMPRPCNTIDNKMHGE